MVIRVLNDSFHYRVGSVMRENPVTRLQSLNRLCPFGGIHWNSGRQAADGFAALLLARVEERRGGRLEPSVDDLVDELLGQCRVTGGQGKRGHDDPVFEALQIPLSVESLQRVGGVVLE